MLVTNKTPVFSSRTEKGQSLIEMAFSAVVLLILIASIVDVGRLLFVWLAIRDAAEEGVVFASICPPFPSVPSNGTAIKNHVKNSSHFPVDLSGNNVQVASAFINTEESVPGSGIQVRVSYQFKFIMPFISAFFPSGFTLEAVSDGVMLASTCP